MPVDTTVKALNAAVDITTLCGTFMDTMRKIIAIQEEVSKAGIEFPGMDFTGASQTLGRKVELDHCNGDDVNNALVAVSSVKSSMDTAYQTDVLDKVRP